jgi:hypothetical protein
LLADTINMFAAETTPAYVQMLGINLAVRSSPPLLFVTPKQALLYQPAFASHH